MSHPNIATALARVVVDEMARLGVATFVMSPGSRSGALALAANEHPQITTKVIIDERSAAFYALGVSKATGLHTAVVSTSGTAAANFFPAVVEADMSCTKLVAITADRPEELRGVGANQTIDQRELFGKKVRAFTSLDTPFAPDDLNERWRRAVGQLLAVGETPRPGPVHLNIGFREPTVPLVDDGRTTGLVYPHPTGRIEGPTHREVLAQAPVAIEGTRGLIVAGDGEYDRDRLMEHSRRLGWPVLATALSGLRGEEVVTTYHHLLSRLNDELVPDSVVAVGSIGPSDRLESLVDLADERVRIDRWHRVIDPHLTATHRVAGDVNELLTSQIPSTDRSWLQSWLRAERETREEVSQRTKSSETMTGGLIAITLNEIDWELLVVGSSLPVRETDAHLVRSGRVLANRGASGIDGFVSTALGAASEGTRALAFGGDLSVLHDSNGFLGEVDCNICFVVMDNGGGGLFDDLPQADHAADFERLFVTPHGRDLEKLAAFHGIGYSTAESVVELAHAAGQALDAGGISMIRVPVDRAIDKAARSQL